MNEWYIVRLNFLRLAANILVWRCCWVCLYEAVLCFVLCKVSVCFVQILKNEQEKEESEKAASAESTETDETKKQEEEEKKKEEERKKKEEEERKKEEEEVCINPFPFPWFCIK